MTSCSLFSTSRSPSLLPTICILATLCASGLTRAVAGPPAQADDANAVASAAITPDDTANTAASYDSDYTRSTKGTLSSGNSPEDDARPGAYYFGLGAYAFQHKNYRFAVDMYQVAASWAYKPAEYNLGVIYARGQGVPVDLPRAMAWMSLAAERNDADYVQAREIVYSQLNKGQFDQANVIWRELKKTYGDEIALRRAKARWAEVRSHMTGSHVGSSGNLKVGEAASLSAPEPSGPTGRPLRVTTTAAEILSGSEDDGTIAYRQLRESDNPYDPKFERLPIGIATVEPLVPVKTQKVQDAPAIKTDDVNHNR